MNVPRADRTSLRCAVAGLTIAITLASGALVRAPHADADETVTVCGPNPNTVFNPGAVSGISTGQSCPTASLGGGGMEIWSAGGHVGQGHRAAWQATAPAGLEIVGASIPNPGLLSVGVNDGDQYGGGFYWAGGGAETHDGESSAGFGPFVSSYFGFQLVCGVTTCTSATSNLDVGEINLYVRETAGPALTAPDGLWQAPGWIRGRLDAPLLRGLALRPLRPSGDDQRSASRKFRFGPLRLGMASVQRASCRSDDPHRPSWPRRSSTDTERLRCRRSSGQLLEDDLRR